MSLLCGAMTWLRANAARMNRIAAAEASAAAAAVDDDEPDWVRAHAAKEAGETILRREEKERELQEKCVALKCPRTLLLHCRHGPFLTGCLGCNHPGTLSSVPQCLRSGIINDER